MTKTGDFRLKTLFKVKERAKKSAEDALVLAEQKVRRDQHELDQLSEDLSQKIAHRDQRRHQYLQEAAQGGTTVNALRIQEWHVQSLKAKEELLKNDIAKQEERLAQSQKTAKTRHGDMLNANRDFKTVEKVKDRWTLERRKAIEYREDQARDEISQAQFVRLKSQT